MEEGMPSRSTHLAPARGPRGLASPATGSSWTPVRRSHRDRLFPRPRLMPKQSRKEHPRRRIRSLSAPVQAHRPGRGSALPQRPGAFLDLMQPG